MKILGLLLILFLGVSCNVDDNDADLQAMKQYNFMFYYQDSIVSNPAQQGYPRTFQSITLLMRGITEEQGSDKFKNDSVPVIISSSFAKKDTTVYYYTKYRSCNRYIRY